MEELMMQHMLIAVVNQWNSKKDNYLLYQFWPTKASRKPKEIELNKNQHDYN